MHDQDRTREELNAELERLRGRIAELEAMRAGTSQAEQSEEALWEIKQRYRSFFENAAVAVALVDQDGRVVEANDADCRFLGYEHSELVGKHFTEFTHPHDIDLDVDLYRSMIGGHRLGYEIEKRYVRKDGKTVWGRLAVSLIRDSQGSPRYTSVVCYDVTDRKRMEESLYLKNYMFDASIAANSIADTDGVITQANQAFLSIWGYSGKEEVIGKKISEFLQNADEAAAIIEALNNSGKWEGNYTARKKDGSTFIAFGLATVLKDEKGAMIGYQSSVLDVTDRKQAEEALQESEEQYRAIFEGVGEAVFVHRMDMNAPTGRFIAVNDVACRHLGYTREELLSLSLPEVDPLDEAEIPSVLDALKAGQEALFETVHITKDGRRVPVEVRARTIPYLGGPAVLSVARDITERRRSEEVLRRRTQGLAALLEVSKSLTATLDLEAVLQATTDGVTKLFGLETAAVYLLQEGTLRLWATTPPLHPKFPEELRIAPLEDHPHIRQAMSSGQPVLIPDMTAADLTQAERAVAERRNLRTVLFLPLVAGVKSVGTLIVGSLSRPRDIADAEIDLCSTLANLAALAVENAQLYTSGQEYAAELEKKIAEREQAEQERLELERRLLHAQKLESLGVLAGGIAHDFNNLLMAVLGNLDLALQKLSPVSPARANIEQCAAAARRATDLTRQMLAYSGKGRFMMKAMDLSELVEENAHLFRSSVARTAALDLRLDRSLPAIEADPGQIQQVVMNLITNASEAIGEKAGTITITSGVLDCDEQCLGKSRIEAVPRAGRFVYIEVADTGCGMDEETQQKLFDPFFSTKAIGRGLGMSAILGIVRGHEGALFVESEVNAGTTIRILFPAGTSVPTAAAKAGAAAAEASAPAGSGTVLVVDDEDVVRSVCKAMVESFGLPVLTASDGREAVEVFRRNEDSIRLVILDLMMPNMDGMAAFKELIRIRPEVKVILSSGYNEQESVQRLSSLGLAGFIQKPYSLQNLRDAMKKANAGGV